MKKKVIKMDKELHDAIRQQLESFKEKFGREAGPDDPLFFDLDSDVPTPLSELKLKKELSEAVDIYARMVTRLLTDGRSPA